MPPTSVFSPPPLLSILLSHRSFFLFFFSHFLLSLSLSLSLRRFPRVKIDTRLSNVHYVPKATLSSVIFFGVTDNNMAYNRIGIMPVALRPDTKSRILLWHIARSYVCRAFSIVSWCINSRSRLISTEFSLFQPGKEKKKGKYIIHRVFLQIRRKCYDYFSSMKIITVEKKLTRILS